MSIVGGSDERTIVSAAGITGNFSNVVAVDTISSTGFLPGSGYMISSNHLLTADHVMDGNSTGRVTLAADVASLPSRANPSSPVPVADRNIAAQLSFDPPSDLALVRTTTALVSDANVLGMLVVFDNSDLDGLPIDVTGFPWVITQPAISNNTDDTGRTLFTADGTIVSTTNTTIQYSQDLDTEGGQSGSGIILDVSDLPASSPLLATSSPLAGVSNDLIIGVHTNGGGIGSAGLSGNNLGNIITEGAYHEISDQMEADFGSSAAARAASLPVNVLLGSDSGTFSFLTGAGDDYMQGSFRREMIIGQGGDDRMEGSGGDDQIDGGAGVDQALFSGLFTEYDFNIVNRFFPIFEFEHVRGSMADGKDTTASVEFAVFEYEDNDRDGTDDDGDVFFVPLLVDPANPNKLRDGPNLTYDAEVRDSEDPDASLIGTFSAELPAFTFDGDLDYELTIGAEQSILYNFAYIIDVSGSMRGGELTQTQAAYEALTNFLISDGIAARSNFAVIPFNSSARLIADVGAQGAISAVNSLSAGGGTSFGPALSVAESWFESLDTVRSATNIAYFLSDGQGSGASTALQTVDETFGFGGVPVDVRAFGIGSGASFSSLNTIDSNSAQFLSNPSDLIGAFGSSGISRDTIDRIEVLLAGVVVDTIAPAALTDDPLGLRYEGTLDGLDVGREADNDVVFRLVFNDGTPTSEIDARVTSGQEEVVEQSDDGTEVRVTFSVDLRDYDATALAESLVVVANNLSNTITLGDSEANVEANGGDDTVIMGSARAVIDGGEGIDTVRFGTTRDEAGAVLRSGDVVSVGSQASLVNVEFIAFTDTLINTQTLQESPIVSLNDTAIRIDEGDSGTTEVQFTLSVAQAAASDIVISFATRDGDAEAGTDYTAATGQAIIAAGETEANVTLQVNGDFELEDDEEFFVDFTTDGLTLFTGAQATATGGVLIETDDSRIDLSVVGDRFTFLEGDEGTTSSLGLSLFRTGATDFEETVTYTVEGGGPDAADADDFATPMTGTVTFAAGDDSLALDIAIAGDSTVEAAETFRIFFEGSTGGSSIDPTSNVFTIENDDQETINEINGTDGRDNLIGTDGADAIRSFGGSYDMMRGGSEADQFIFGAEANNGLRERDVILDYEVGIDEIVLQDGATVGSIRETSSQVVIFLEGDRDAIYVRGDGVTADDIAIVGTTGEDDVFALV